MNILIYSPIYELSEIIAENIEELGESCYTFKNTSLLMSFFSNCKNLPDLLILDYTSFNHEFFNLRNYLIELHKLFPLIYFNDPCPVYPERAYHWKEQIKLLFDIKDKELLDNYFKIFQKVQSTVENPELIPYIPLMQTNLPFPNHLTKAQALLQNIKKDNPISIYNFKKRNNLPDNLFYLLEIFYNNQEKPLSIDEIIQKFEEDDKSIKESSLRVSISRLNKAISNDKECSFFFLKKNNKYQIIFN